MGLDIAAPDPGAPLHSQMKKGWFLLEPLPRLSKRSKWPDQKGFLGYYLPLGQYRYNSEDAEIHPSVQERRQKFSGDYNPPNLPS